MRHNSGIKGKTNLTYKFIFIMAVMLIISFIYTTKVNAAGAPFECYYYKEDGQGTSYPLIVKYDGTAVKATGSIYNYYGYKGNELTDVSQCPSQVYGVEGSNHNLVVYSTSQAGKTNVTYNLKYKFTANSIEFNCNYRFNYNNSTNLYADLTLKYINGLVKYTLTKSPDLKTGETDLTISYDISGVTAADFNNGSGVLSCPNKDLFEVSFLDQQKMTTTRKYSFTTPTEMYQVGKLDVASQMDHVRVDTNTLKEGTDPTPEPTSIVCGPYEWSENDFLVRQITLEYAGSQILTEVVDLKNGVPSGDIGLNSYTFDVSLIEQSEEYQNKKCGAYLYYYIDIDGTGGGKVFLSYDRGKLLKPDDSVQAKNTNSNNVIGTGVVVDPITGEPIDCKDFIIEDKATGETVSIIDGIFNIIMIVAPILLIVFGSVDFAKATFSGDEQAVKKAGSNFGKRVIATVLLFLLPLTLKIILNVAYNAGVFTDMPQICIGEEIK